MFCDKDFADGANAVRSSGSAAVAIAGIVTVVTIVGKKHAGNSGGQRISFFSTLEEKPGIPRICIYRAAQNQHRP